ncbi:MAG: amino acid ABC transporter substrate-bindnig protein [Candidatus Liberibacter europaeus]|uniref:Amino acid ABC transporter substrate-bindnig protein n=1 Tax=Candidatus Liberibacter europaeus TaxID=744859 RepID=A0A2T4VX65_9HYPH|nr:amino acid ABC transporter substrate-bindnig protein [Candidatus Liberibacter europaeus]PTL86366.1 MAG: amino acid ABC transporter substrate-bindnig protein [Candidatus Liberibacter europaeus]
MYKCRNLFFGVVVFISLSCTGLTAYADILKEVKKRGFLSCGMNVGVSGFSMLNAKGEWTGFDIDFCKALSSAIFNDKSKVKYVPLNAKERFIALQSGEIDVLSRNTSWTLLRETSLGLFFRAITYFDGQGFMMRKKPGITSALQLSESSICVQSGTSTELTLADYFRANGMKFHPIVFERVEEIDAAYRSNRCDVYSGDISALYSLRLSTDNPSEHIILPEMISKEPLGPAILQGDSVWSNIVTWTHYALVTAEELGITQKNVDDMLNSTNPDVRRFLGSDKNSNIGKSLGLKNDWAYGIIKNVGNYGEIFNRNLGSGSVLKIPRNHNNLYSKGGLMYAPPIR